MLTEAKTNPHNTAFIWGGLRVRLYVMPHPEPTTDRIRKCIISDIIKPDNEAIAPIFIITFPGSLWLSLTTRLSIPPAVPKEHRCGTFHFRLWLPCSLGFNALNVLGFKSERNSMVLACFEFGVSETAFVCTSFVSSDDTITPFLLLLFFLCVRMMVMLSF